MSLLPRNRLRNGLRRYIPPQALEEAAFLEARLPLRAFVTLTFQHEASRLKLDSSFKRWIQAIQAESRATIGWIKVYENDPARHIHAVLLAWRPLDCRRAELLWNQVTGSRCRDSAEVEVYQPGRNGLAYVLKSMDRDSEDIQFSDNLPAFDLDAPERSSKGTAAERRQSRRIQNQRVQAIEIH
jgi:hypothetical protein